MSKYWCSDQYIAFSPGLALNYILQNNFKENVGMRPNSRKIGVLVTDGKSQDDIIANSQNLRDNGIELYAIGKTSFAFLPLKHSIKYAFYKYNSLVSIRVCELTTFTCCERNDASCVTLSKKGTYVIDFFLVVGVKNADENELRSIASDPDEIHMYNVIDFSFLLDIVDDLTNNLCASVKGPGNLKDNYVMWALYIENTLEYSNVFCHKTYFICKDPFKLNGWPCDWTDPFV